MRRYGGFLLGLAAAMAALGTSKAAEKPDAVGVGPAYEALGRLPVEHQGRDKPLDTLAREEVKQIFGRETIKLHGDTGAVVETWGPVAALFDWSARPEFWDDQPFILVEYLPLKRLILADAIKTRLSAAADRPGTSPAARTRFQEFAEKSEFEPAALSSLAQAGGVQAEDRQALERYAAQLGESHKWFSPRTLEEAQILVDGRRVPFKTWFRGAASRRGDPSGMGGPAVKLTEVEKKGVEVGTRLVHYQAIRDRVVKSVEPMLVMPRPSNAAALTFCARALKKGREEGPESLTPLQLDAASALASYWNDIPIEDREMPGEDAKFDKRFTGWLQTRSVWVPLTVLLAAKPQELAEAGFPGDRVEAFRAAFKEAEKGESDTPGRLPEAKATALLSAARALGEALNKDRYPTEPQMVREAYFNATNPFFKAPVAYGAGVAFLAASLGFLSIRRGSPLWWVGASAYAAGMVGLISGIALEVLGFSLRVRISGWAPVTNMYETVIWVSLVAAVLSLVFEMIFRKTYSALAGSGVALLGTVLAANVPLLDPGIRALQPVLRSNYWLTIHVLTEVSSYAAFALAMGLGMIATMYYLTATYRRSPGYLELARPAIVGLPLLILGSVGLAAMNGQLQTRWIAGPSEFYFISGLAAVGGSLTIVGMVSMLGEAIGRISFRDDAGLDNAAIAGPHPAAPATSVQTVTIGEGMSPASSASKPTVSEIRAMAAQNRPKLDARGRSMQETAAVIKPLSNFIYRTMQVGVLLVAAGTFLGGWWADKSWGRFWGWDPKEVWALITLLVYLIPLHGRFAGWVNMFGLVMASVVCFLSVIMAWYGVNFVLGVGLHSYGFVEGGSQGVVGAVVLAVLSVAGAAGWRRHLASRTPAVAA